MAGSILNDKTVTPAAARHPSAHLRISHFRRHPESLPLESEIAAANGGYSNNLVGHGA